MLQWYNHEMDTTGIILHFDSTFSRPSYQDRDQAETNAQVRGQMLEAKAKILH